MTYTFNQKMRKILNIALPSGGNSLLDIANLALGMYFIAHISADSEITKHNIVALGLGMSYWMFLFALTTIFYVGTNAQVSRAFGERKYEKMSAILSTMSLGALFFSIPIFIIATALGDVYFDWMRVGDATKALGLMYLEWLLYAIPALLLKTIFISALAATGDTKSVFFVKIISTSLNIVLNFILIFGVDSLNIAPMGIVGAGVANVIVSYFEGIILFGILCGAHRHLKIAPIFQWHILTSGLYIGVPSGIERGLTILSMTLITKFMTDYGLEVIAGFQIGGRVESFICMPGFGFQVAAMALVGQMLGAKRLDLAESFLRTILLISSLIMGALGIVMCVFGRELSSLFSTDALVLNFALAYLIAVGLSQVPQICVFVLDGALRGSGATKLSLWINTSSIWLLRIFPMWLCIYLHFRAEYIFAIICIETFLRACIFGFVFYKGVWKRYIVAL